MRLVLVFAALSWVGCSALVSFDRSRIEGDGGGMDAGDAGPVMCTVGSNEGCASDELCCGGPGGEACIAVSGTQCSSCSAGCLPETTSGCVDRGCVCGTGPECTGDTPFCDDEAGACVACRDDGDCEGASAQCVDGTCRACDPEDYSGCGAAEPICNDSFECEPCTQEDDQCLGDLVCNTDGECGCDDDSQCTTPTTPICDTGSDICVGCADDEECEALAGSRDICLDDGSCGACDPDAVPTGCTGATSICDGTTATCRACVASDCSGSTPACATSGANMGQCVACIDDATCDDGVCDTTSNTCVECDSSGLDTDCPASEPVCASNECRACMAGECGGMRCVTGGATDPGDVGSCAACNPANHAGCATAAAARCDPAALTCQPCSDAAHCAHIDADFICVSGVCQECNPANHAGCANPAPICGAGNTCRPCQAGDTCPGGASCVAGECRVGECTDATQADACPGAQVCSATLTCVDCEVAADCGTTAEGSFTCDAMGRCVCNASGPDRCTCTDGAAASAECMDTRFCRRNNGTCSS